MSSGEGNERLVRGPQGERGERGQAGEGMTKGARHAVVFLFVLSFLLAGGAYWLATSAVDKAVASRASVVQLCQLGNQARTQQIALWDRLVHIAPPPPGETPAQQRARQQAISSLIAYVHKFFAPRDCAKRLNLGQGK